MDLITICGHTFDQDRINSESLILDLGANRGVFSKGVMDRFDCTVVAYEPSRLLCENQLKELSDGYEKFSFYPNAIWSEKKTLMLSDFSDKEGGTSGVANSVIPHKRDTRKDGRYIRDKYEVECVSLEEVLNSYDKVDLLKVDIEGSEIEVLTKISEDNLKKCNQICVEFHLFCQGEYAIKITEADLESIISKMQNLGFESKKTNYKHPDFLFYK
tara:strand:+ start:2059 stop:2703 length:645 start_codon:yes stop_codon:yes gene_type:complete